MVALASYGACETSPDSAQATEDNESRLLTTRQETRHRVWNLDDKSRVSWYVLLIPQHSTAR